MLEGSGCNLDKRSEFRAPSDAGMSKERSGVLPVLDNGSQRFTLSDEPLVGCT